MDRLFGNRRNDNKREREKETGREKKPWGTIPTLKHERKKIYMERKSKKRKNAKV